MRRFLLFFLACLMFAASALAETTVTLTFTGDVTLGSEERTRKQDSSFVSMAEKMGYDYFFAHFRDFFAQDDLTIVNLEGVLSDSPKGENKDKTYRFRGDPGYVQILQSGSVELASLANNHTMDYGKRGYQDTQTALDAASIGYFANQTACVREVNGIKLAFISMNSTTFNGNRKWAKKEIARLKDEEGVHAVIFVVHAGQEYGKRRNALQETFGHQAIDMGADLVVMHHPHVVQGLEIYKNRTIVYSLGNFCFGGNKAVRALEAMVLRAQLTFGEEGSYQGQLLSLYPAHISGTPEDNNYQPRPVSGEDAAKVFERVQYDSDFELPAFDVAAGCLTLPYLPAQ